MNYFDKHVKRGVSFWPIQAGGHRGPPYFPISFSRARTTDNKPLTLNHLFQIRDDTIHDISGGSFDKIIADVTG
ncbi:MAG: hypothetical protein OET63_12375, partial [Desulfobacterales bacterium]|nr:hypothetical protein [Desulfobacterales bacterium]